MNQDSQSHRATPSDWACIENHANSIGHLCILELRARIEALEAQQRTASAEVLFTGLVKRVAQAMGPSSQSAMDAGELPYGSARAAIHEMAAAAKDLRFTTAKALIDWLEREVGHG